MGACMYVTHVCVMRVSVRLYPCVSLSPTHTHTLECICIQQEEEVPFAHSPPHKRQALDWPPAAVHAEVEEPYLDLDRSETDRKIMGFRLLGMKCVRM
jgi:hypothetical protein